MRTLHGDGLEALLLASLVKELDLKGTLHVLRHGFKFYGKTFRLATFKPAHGLNDEVLSLYQKNRLTVTRQVLCHPGKHDTVDLVFALNGLPVATCELKNPGTGQSWRHAVRQYQKDRDPRAPLFRFKARALVHFAADPDEVHMATRLVRAETHFLPFNRGSQPGEIECGAGNPQHPSGDRTGYFWQDAGRARARQLSRHPWAFSVRRDPGAEGRRRQGWTAARHHKEKACNSELIVRTALANPLDKFELGTRKLIEDLMIQRIAENDQIVTRYMADMEFQASAFPVLAREIFDAVRSQHSDILNEGGAAE